MLALLNLVLVFVPPFLNLVNSSGSTRGLFRQRFTPQYKTLPAEMQPFLIIAFNPCLNGIVELIQALCIQNEGPVFGFEMAIE
jgi:hypothetical protein